MIRMIIIYRPMSSSPLITFCDEFSVLLGELALASGELLLTGDFNIDIDSSGDPCATHFMNVLASFDLKQCVTTPTHASGHSLDFIFTRSQCRGPHKPQLQTKTIRYTNLHSID